jgi:uncharacterized protein YuzE
MATMSVWYDQEGDFLDVTFEDALATLEEIGDDVFERRTADGRVVGFAVLNFSKHDKDSLQLPLAVTAKSAA